MLNPFGFGLMFIIIGTVIVSRTSSELFKNFLKLELTFSIFKLNYGYFFKLGGSEIQYGDIVLALLFLSALLHLSVSRLHRESAVGSIILILVVVSGIIGVWFFPANVSVIGFDSYGGWDGYLRGELTNMAPVSFSMQSILMLLRVFFFVVVLVAIKSTLTETDWIRSLEIFTIFAKALIVYGLLEILIRYIMNFDLNDLLNQFFGRGVSTGGGQTRLQGLSREPSHYALALFNMMILFMVRMRVRKQSGNDAIWLCLIVLIGSLANTFSFFVVGLSAVLLFSALSATNLGKVNFTYLFVYGLAALFALLLFLIYSWTQNSGLSMRIIEAGIQAQNGINGSYVIGEDYGSEASRIIGMIESFNSYLARPIIGLGLGTTYCVSGFISILSNIGFLGLVVWLRLLTVSYFKLPNPLTTLCVFLPILVTNDLGALYDTAYLAIIPLIFLASRVAHSKHGEKVT